jgi:1-acyl-sn-glycerol-3-phosphate acyltransferase
LKVLGKIGFAWFALVFVGIFLVFYPLFLVFLSHPKLYPIANFLRRIWAWLTVLCSFSLPIYTKEEKHIPGPCVLVSNHTSYLDIVSIGLFSSLKTSFMGKIELARIPLFGIFFRTVDIGVDRKSIRDSHKAFTEAGSRIKDAYCVVIFPEGTIWDKTPLLKPFKNGAFKLALENGIPIVPVTFYNNFKRLPDEKFAFYPGTIRFKVHRAIPTAHLNIEDSDRLKDEIYALIENELKNKHIIHENHG